MLQKPNERVEEEKQREKRSKTARKDEKNLSKRDVMPGKKEKKGKRRIKGSTRIHNLLYSREEETAFTPDLSTFRLSLMSIAQSCL